MIKNIDVIKRDFIRLRSNERGLYLEVCQIQWEGPHTPRSHWVCVKRFGEPPQHSDDACILRIPMPDEGSEGNVVPLADVDKAIEKLLRNRRYFQICGHCRTLNPVGWMDDDFACQSCAEKKLGVVY